MLAKAERSLSPKEIAEQLGRSGDAVRQTLGRMVEDSEIAKEGRGKYTVVTGGGGGCHNGDAAEGSSQAGCHNGHNVTTGEKLFDINDILQQRL